MATDLSKSFDLIDISQSGSGGACGPDGCACGHGSAEDTAVADAATGIGITGMTCSHCVSSVTEELSRIPGVDGVAIDLVPGGVSRVTIDAAGPLDHAAIRAAVEEAGYALAE